MGLQRLLEGLWCFPFFLMEERRESQPISVEQWVWNSPEEDNYGCWIHANFNQATIAVKMLIGWSLHDRSSQ